MEVAGRRENTTDYHELAGMSTNNSKAASCKTSSVKSKRSDQDVAAADLNEQLEELQEKIDSNPAYVVEQYEKVDRQYGSVYETEANIMEDITVEDAQKLQKVQKTEIITMERRLKQLKERQQCLDLKEKFMNKRRETEVMM